MTAHPALAAPNAPAKRKARRRITAATTLAKSRTVRPLQPAKPGSAHTPRKVIEAERVRTLAVDATRAQDAYILAALKLLARHGTLRAHTLGKAMFSSRSDVAAHAAAKRTLAAAMKQGLVDAKRRTGTQHVFYALTKRGADTLNARDPSPALAVSGVSLLAGDMTKANHREWCAVIAEAAAKREGLESYGELEIHREPASVSKSLVNEFFAGQHVPDVLTFHEDEHLVVWHEVELSRRNSLSPTSRKRLEVAEKKKVSPTKVRDGREQFAHLLQTLRKARTLSHDWTLFEVMLVCHCATELIRSELSRLIVATFGKPDQFSAFPAKLETLEPGRHYRVNFEVGPRATERSFEMLLNLLPTDDPAKASVFDAELLWPDAPHGLREDPLSEKFIAAK